MGVSIDIFTVMRGVVERLKQTESCMDIETTAQVT